MKMKRKVRFNNILQNLAIFEKSVKNIDKSKIEKKRLLKKQNLPKQFITIQEFNEISLFGNCDNVASTSNNQNKELICQQPRRARSLIEAIEFDFEDIDSPLTEVELEETNESHQQTEMSPPRKPQKIHRTYSYKNRKEKEMQQSLTLNQDQLDYKPGSSDSENDEEEDGPHLDSFTIDGEVLVNPTQEIDISTNSNIQGNLMQLSQFFAVETQDEDPTPKGNSQDYKARANIKLIDESMNDLFEDDERYLSCCSFESENDPIAPVELAEPIEPPIIMPQNQDEEVPDPITKSEVPVKIPVQMKELISLEKLNVPNELPMFQKASGQKIEMNQKFKIIGENFYKSVMEAPESSLALPTFQKASGKKIEVKPESMKIGLNMFRDVMETPENNGGESENKQTTGEAIKTKTESLDIKQNMFKDFVESDDDELSQLDLNIPTEVPMFQKASGKKIEGLLKFQKLGEDFFKEAMELEAPEEASGQKIEVKAKFPKIGGNFAKSIFDTPIEGTSKQTKPTSTSTPVSTNPVKPVQDEFKVENLLDSETLKAFDDSWDNIDFGSIDITGINKNESSKENLSNKRVASPLAHNSNNNPSKYLKLSNRITKEVEIENSPANDYVSFHKSISNRTSTPKPINRCLGILRRSSSKIMLSQSLKPTRLSDKFKH